MNKKKIEYILIRFIGFFLSFFPYSVLRALGKFLGTCSFYLLNTFRKIALSNLAMAHSLKLPHHQIRKIAKESFQNVAINCLEMFRIAKENDFSKLVQCENPKLAHDLIKNKTGIVFFCAHQSNWDLLFLDGNLRMPGIAIGKPFSNPYLYHWIKKIREKTGGTIITPKEAFKEGSSALNQGKFLGIVGDQADLNSSYRYPLFGREASNTLSPALFAYKTNSPIMVATTRRVKQGYKIHYSDPIWPDRNTPLKIEAPRIMNQALRFLEKSIKESPGEWLWLHNRWKTQTPKAIYKSFRYDSICLILDHLHLQKLKGDLPLFRKIYPKEHITLWIPKNETAPLDCDEICTYRSLSEVKKNDYRFKLLFNFTQDPSLQKHFEKLGVLHSYNWFEIQAKGFFEANPSNCIKRAILRPEAL